MTEQRTQMCTGCTNKRGIQGIWCLKKSCGAPLEHVQAITRSCWRENSLRYHRLGQGWGSSDKLSTCTLHWVHKFAPQAIQVKKTTPIRGAAGGAAASGGAASGRAATTAAATGGTGGTGGTGAAASAAVRHCSDHVTMRRRMVMRLTIRLPFDIGLLERARGVDEWGRLTGSRGLFGEWRTRRELTQSQSDVTRHGDY